MELFFRGLVLTLNLSLFACSTLQVSREYDPNVSFKHLSDYAWIPESTLPQKNQYIDNENLDKQIRTSVNKSLTSKGFELKQSDKPSFLIGYHVAIDQKTSINTVNTRYTNQGAWSPNAWRGTTDLGQHVFEQGTIIIDIIDTSSNELIWRSNASAEIDPFANSNTRVQRIDRAIKKMLNDFPPSK